MEKQEKDTQFVVLLTRDITPSEMMKLISPDFLYVLELLKRHGKTMMDLYEFLKIINLPEDHDDYWGEVESRLNVTLKGVKK